MFLTLGRISIIIRIFLHHFLIDLCSYKNKDFNVLNIITVLFIMSYGTIFLYVFLCV